MNTKTITITKATGTWVVRAGGAVIGESKNALELVENGYEPVIYFPRDDIEMAFLEPSDHSTTCPHKGEATYFGLAAKSGIIENAAWSYESPKEDVARIKDHLAFYTEKAAVEQL
ncbi:MAG: DUF427 domain-containing protein [Pseudomonadota bacterium]